jgi:hypothetical protein
MRTLFFAFLLDADLRLAAEAHAFDQSQFLGQLGAAQGDAAVGLARDHLDGPPGRSRSPAAIDGDGSFPVNP